MAYRLAECGAADRAHGEKGYLVVEIYEAFHNHSTGSGATAFLSFTPSGIGVGGASQSALAVSAGAHHGLHNAGEAYLGYGCVKLLAGGCETVGRCGEAELFGREAADSFTIHGKESSAGCWSNVVALFLELHEHRGGNRLNFGYDMVGVLEFYHPSQSFGVEHIDHMAAVGYLHGGGAGVAVYGYHFNAQALELDSHFFAELAAAEQEGFDGRRGGGCSYFHC